LYKTCTTVTLFPAGGARFSRISEVHLKSFPPIFIDERIFSQVYYQVSNTTNLNSAAGIGFPCLNAAKTLYMADPGKLFKSRQDAAKKLAAQLMHYRHANPLVLGIPKGGAEIAYYLAKELNAGFAVVIAKKISHPTEPGTGIGAVCEEGTVFLDEENKELHNKMESEILKIRSEILRQVLLYREGRPLPELKDRLVIIADDMIDKGVSVASVFLLCVRHGAAKIVVASPVSTNAYVPDLAEADELVVLHHVDSAADLAAVYQNPEPATEEQVLFFINKYHERVVR
jgi:putative phosphoribosyl transferase